MLHTRPNESREEYISKTATRTISSIDLVPIEKTTSQKGLGESADELQNFRDTNINRYCEILTCIEDLILDHILHDHNGVPEISRLSQLVPSIGTFFTPLPLKDTFLDINMKKGIAGRRYVPPSFNDVRYILNFAQVTAISRILKLITL